MKIFLSSTWIDLEEYRECVIKAIERLRHQDRPVEWIGMEAFSAANERPAELCGRYVRQADLYVGIFGVRYGSIDKETGFSFTEMEYREAVQLNKPRLLFIIDEDNARVAPKHFERDPHALELLKKLKDDIQRDRKVDYFKDPGGLAAQVLTALEPYIGPCSPDVVPRIRPEDYPLHPVPEPPPLIGRERETSRYRQCLKEVGIALIEGMAGVGKTIIGAHLAREEMAAGRHVFWITFDLFGTHNAEEFLWDLAAFLARNGKSELWQFLEQESRDARTRDTVKRCHYMTSSLFRGPFTLCLDNFHAVLKDPDITYYLTELRKNIQGPPEERPTRFIIMTREVPPSLRDLVGEPLQGFTRDDARTFLAAHAVRLPKPQFEQLYERVNGNPQFLRLSLLAGLKTHQRGPAAMKRFIQGLAGQPSVRDYLMDNVYGVLSPSEKQVLEALAVFTVPVLPEAVKWVMLDEGVSNLMHLLNQLVQRQLIVEDQETRQVGLHSLVRDYCYDNLDLAYRQQLHRKAAMYYDDQKDYIMAVQHYRQTQAFSEALRVLSAHEAELTSTGRLDSMLEQLAALPQDHLSTEEWIEVGRMRGNALERRGDCDEAIAVYQQALRAVTDAPMRAKLYRGLGNCYRDKGLFSEAITCYQQQLEIGETQQDASAMAQAHLGLGLVNLRIVDHPAAVHHFEQAAKLGKETDDAVLAARAHASLALTYVKSGDLERAIESQRLCMKEFQRANRPELVAAAWIDLGQIYHYRRDLEQAIQHYEQAVQIYEKLGYRYGICVGYNNLGEAYLDQGNAARAVEYLEKSAHIAQETGNQYMLMVVYPLLASAYLTCGETDRAMDCAKRALDLTKGAEAKDKEGVTYRILGDIRAAIGQKQQARQDFDTAQQILERVGDQPELARLYRSIGHFLLADPSTRTRGCEYLERALTLFRTLGSEKESMQIANLLQSKQAE